MRGEVSLRLPPDVAYVGLARLVVVSAARLAGMENERVEDLRIAVSEATTNAIVAHRRLENSEGVTLHFGPTDDGFSVTISDTGPGFEPIAPERFADRQWSNESGLGVTIIRGLADRVRFVHSDGMRVSMEFAVGLDVHEDHEDHEDGDGHAVARGRSGG